MLVLAVACGCLFTNFDFHAHARVLRFLVVANFRNLDFHAQACARRLLVGDDVRALTFMLMFGHFECLFTNLMCL